MEVMIGVDPHKGSHTATMLDRRQRELRRITVRAGRRQVEQLLEWVDGVKPRTWAVESAGGMGYLGVRARAARPPPRRQRGTAARCSARTGAVVGLRPELAFEDRGARWELPMDDVDRSQFAQNATAAGRGHRGPVRGRDATLRQRGGDPDRRGPPSRDPGPTGP
jgi:hypothetical protein